MSVVQVGTMGNRRGRVSSIGAQIGALPGQTTQTVPPGGKVRMWRIDFVYTGPAQTLYACWGLKKSGGLLTGVNFDNGAGLQGAAFAAYGMPVEASTNRAYVYVIDAILPIPTNTPEATYDVFVWITTNSSSPKDERYILKIDTDAGIVKVESPVAPSVAVSGMQAGYQKV